MFRSLEHKPSAWYGNSLFIAGTTAFSTRLCICQVLSSEHNRDPGYSRISFKLATASDRSGKSLELVAAFLRAAAAFDFSKFFK